MKETWRTKVQHWADGKKLLPKSCIVQSLYHLLFKYWKQQSTRCLNALKDKNAKQLLLGVHVAFTFCNDAHEHARVISVGVAVALILFMRFHCSRLNILTILNFSELQSISVSQSQFFCSQNCKLEMSFSNFAEHQIQI